MSAILTSDKLIKNIKRRGFVPNDQVTFSDEDLLEMATDEITLGLMESIIDARGDYLVYHIDVPIIQNVNKYDIPSRAHGNKLRDVTVNDANNPEIVIYDLYQTTEEDQLDARNYYTRNTKSIFFLENNKIVLTPDLVRSSSYVLRMYFYMTPSKLVPVSRAGTIMSISDGVETVDSVDIPVKILSFSTLPKHFTSTLKYDVTSDVSPNKITNFDLTPVSVNLTQKTISVRASDLIEPILMGNYVTQAGETIVPNIPSEYHPIVAQRTVRACMEYMNDDAGYAKATTKLQEMEQQVEKIVRSRVEGAPKKIKNRGGTLRNSVNKQYNRRW